MSNKFSQRKNKVVVNIRDFNKITQFNVYSMQLQFDLISIVVDCVYISIFDYINFFHQWFVKLTNRHKLTIVSHKENEQWNVAIMSFRNSLVYVQRQINRIFRVFRFFAKIYVNDIVIFNHNLEKHLRHLNQIFVLFVKLNIVLKSSKTYLRYFTISLFEQKIDRFELSIV